MLRRLEHGAVLTVIPSVCFAILNLVYSTRQHTDVLRRLEHDERKRALAAKLETADENEKVSSQQ